MSSFCIAKAPHIFPAKISMYMYLKIPNSYNSSGVCHFQVLKVKMKHNMPGEIVEVYADPDGSEARGSTVATYANGKVVIGTVEDQLVVCDSKYIF